MTLPEIYAQFKALPPYRRMQALRIACDDALAVWRHYRRDGVPLEYSDSIVGMAHTVDDTLPARALADAAGWLAGEPSDPAIARDYLEPITAMQDDDLDLPDPIEMAYYAIYNFHRFVLGKPTEADELVVLNQSVSSLGALEGDLSPSQGEQAKLDAWGVEWWTRVWDAWASTPEPAYEPSPLDDAAFAALAAGDLDAALEALAIDEPRVLEVRAIVLSLIGRDDDACAAAARGLGVARTPELERWLSRHITELVPEAIAVSPDRTQYAVIRGDRRVVRDLARATAVSDTAYRDRTLRLVRFVSGALCTASDLIDAQGVWATLVESEVEDGYSHDEVVGTRAVVALGSCSIVGRHPAHAVLYAADQRELLGELPVIGAAIAEERTFVVTHDGVRVSVWYRDPPSCARIVGVGGVAPTRIALGGPQLLVTWADGTSSVHVLVEG